MINERRNCLRLINYILLKVNFFFYYVGWVVKKDKWMYNMNYVFGIYDFKIL